MNTSLRVVSFNCQGLLSNAHLVRNLCEDYDVICLQETWLVKQDLSLLSNIHPNFTGFGLSAVDLSDGPLVGRPYGGVAILIRNALSHLCKPVDSIHENRLLGVLFHSVDTQDVLILNAYLPVDLRDNVDEFTDCLGKLAGCMDNFPTSLCCIVGDFNADWNKPFGRELKLFAEVHDLHISDAELLPVDTFTFISAAHLTTSWLDHVLSTQDLHSKITNLTVLKDFRSYDHVPIVLEINIFYGCSISVDRKNIRPHPDWGKATSIQKQEFTSALSQLLHNVKLPAQTITCRDLNCSSSAHRLDIWNLTEVITSKISLAANQCIPCNGSSSSRKVVPGWSEHVCDLYSHAKQAYIIWRDDYARTRFGPAAEAMRSSRARFKHALRMCQNNEEEIRADRMAQAALGSSSFWKEKGRQMSSYASASARVGDCSTPREIASMWNNMYKDIFNCVSDDSIMSSVRSKIYRSLPDNYNLLFSPDDVCIAAKCLDVGKAAGPDGISAECVVHAPRRLSVLLSILFNSMLSHCFIPRNLTDSFMYPILKNKNKSAADINNYRPIAVSSCISKLFEYLIYPHIEKAVYLTSN